MYEERLEQAMGIVLVPTAKQEDDEKYNKYYDKTRLRLIRSLAV